MIQKHPGGKFMLNMVPQPVQEVLQSNKVIPVARKVFKEDLSDMTEYLSWSINNIRLRNGGK
jgi:hypothetical protein